jgi:nitroreductase
MDVFEAIRGRRSIRKFTDESVNEEDLKKILESATLAPSAGNLQPWEFVVVKDQAIKNKLARAAYGQSFIAEAPVAIVVCANVPRTSGHYGSRGASLYCIQDTAAATQNILLAAHALGYGTCWVGAFNESLAAEAINAPEGVRPLAIIPIGRPAERPSPPPRTPLKKILHQNFFRA